MGNRGKTILGVLAAVVVGFVIWTVTTVPKPPAEEKKTGPVEMEYGANTIREEKGGRLVWELTTESSSMDINTQATKFKNATGKYCFEDGRVLTVKAPSGSYDSAKHRVKLSGGVTAEISDGTKLVGETLEWVETDGRLVAEGNARVSRPDILATGDRIEAWDQFENIRATGHAHIEKVK